MIFPISRLLVSLPSTNFPVFVTIPSLILITWIMYGLLPIFRISDMFLICCWTREASNATNMERVKTL